MTSRQIIDNELDDKMDEYRYTGLNQVLDSDRDAEASGKEDTMDVEAVEHDARLSIFECFVVIVIDLLSSC